MKKIFSFVASMAMAGASAQTLPTAVYSLDFEGAVSVADFGGTQVGDGALVQSADPNFGTYYQNAQTAAVATKATNYLRVNQNALQAAANKTKNGVALGFWVNATVANTVFPNINYHYSVLFGFYSADKDSHKSNSDWNWPMFTVNTRTWMQINSAGAWDDFTAEENVNGDNNEAQGEFWLHQHTVEEVVKDSQGNDSTVYVPTAFEDNWHHVALSFDPENNSTTFYVDGAVVNKWNNKEGFYGTEDFMGQLKSGKYDRLYLGGVAQWTWGDPDPAFAYDDFTVYAGTLDEDQISLIMNIKRGEIGDSERLVIAQSQMQQAIEDAYEYNDNNCSDLNSLYYAFGDYLSTLDPTSFETEEEVKAAIASIAAKQDEVAAVVKAHKAATDMADEQIALVEQTAYPGAEEYVKAIENIKASIADPTSVKDVENALQPMQTAKAAYIFSQEMASAEEGIDVTKIIQHPWFVNSASEPVRQGDGLWFEGMTDVLGDNTTPPSANDGGWVNGNTFKVDDARVNWTQGRSCWNNWHNKTTVGSLDVHQDIVGLPEGYYTISADMITNTTPISGQQVYGSVNGAQRVSPVLSGNGWDAMGAGLGQWETLTTDKVYVGKGETLTIGAQSQTTGAAYVGWFCVTNFRLQYYGTEADLSSDLAAKQSEANEAIATLVLAGDKAAANNTLESIVAGTDSDYDKISKLTALIADVNDKAEALESFYQNNPVNDMGETTDDETVRKVYMACSADINEALSADDATASILPSLSNLYKAYIAYAPAVQAAQAWGTEAATNEVNAQIASLAGATPETLAANAAKLKAIMIASVGEFDATADSPKDITGVVENPSFAGDSDKGWTVEGGHANWYSECEFYNTSFDLHQTITGLPAGRYRVEVQGFYRDGSNEQSLANYAKADGSSQPNALLYANDITSPLLMQPSDSIVGVVPGSHADGTNYAWYQPNANDAEEDELVSYPDGMNSAWYMMNELGLYSQNSVEVDIAPGEALTFGVKKSEKISADWTIFDNFRLYCIGIDPTAISATVATPQSIEAIYTVDGAKRDSMQKGINIVRQSNGNVKKVIVK